MSPLHSQVVASGYLTPSADGPPLELGAYTGSDTLCTRITYGALANDSSR
jgi:hypothetical protein